MKRLNYLAIFLLTHTLVALEIVWTRIFSAEFFYTFAFLILSLAILGLGLGALVLRYLPYLKPEKHLPSLLSATAFFALVGPPVVLHSGLDFNTLLTESTMLIIFFVVLLLAGAAFFTGGMALALLFKHNYQNISRLYMADLFGAGLGVLTAVLLMNGPGTPVAAVLICLPALLAAFFTGKRYQLLWPVVLIAGIIAYTPKAPIVLEKPRQERAPVIYKHWNAMSKIKIFDFNEDYKGLNVDNLANSPVYRFDGNWDRPDSLKFRFGIDVSYLIQQNDSCVFMSLGAGGGTDVLQALQEGATEIHAVEINPLINHLMLDGELADFSGHIYKDPRVRVITEDARTYVRHFHNKFDLVYSLSSNTFAALTSGAFALAENYIFTTEAFEDYYRALSENGFLMMEHQFYMPRLVSEVLTALEQLAVPDPKNHIAVYDLPKMKRNILLLGKEPLTEEIRQNAFGRLSEKNYHAIHLLYPSPDSTADNLINRIVTQGWEKTAADAPIDISPCTDDRPFCAQLGLWKNLNWEQMKKLSALEIYGFPLAKALLTAIIGIIFLLIIPVNILPFLKLGRKFRTAGWFYFFFIGMGFMIVEIVLIQKYTLFIGSAAYTVFTILLALLLGSGLGSRFSHSLKPQIPFVAVIIWLLMEVIVFTPIKYALGDVGLAGRILVSILFIFPAGFFMGMPFPIGTKKVGELVDWGFAVNGAASVLGSAAILLVSFNYGFATALLLGGCCYLVGLILVSLEADWIRGQS